MTALIDSQPLGPRVTPDARVILPADTVATDRAAWLTARRQGIGGSDASTIAGVNWFGSLYELWLDKTGQRDLNDKASDAADFGRRVEPVLADWFTDLTGIRTTRAGLMQSKTRPWQLASVDRLTDDGGILECKSTGWRMAEEWADDQVADHAEVQTQHYLSVTGRSHAWVFALVDRAPNVRRVDRDDDLIGHLLEMEARFWNDHVIAKVEPRPYTGRDLAAIKAHFPTVVTETVAAPREDVIPVLTKWAEAKAAVKAAERDADVLEAQLRLIAGDAEEVLVDGVPAFTVKGNGTFSESRFRENCPNLAAEFVKTREVVDLDRLKAEHPLIYTAHRARVVRAAKGAI